MKYDKGLLEALSTKVLLTIEKQGASVGCKDLACETCPFNNYHSCGNRKERNAILMDELARRQNSTKVNTLDPTLFRLVEVRDDGETWFKSNLIATLPNGACVATKSSPPDFVVASRYDQWREIPEPKTELSMEEIAKKFKIPLDTLRIKD